ncbi:uncharacterized protein LOC108104288 [Drosophila eugracilis]|uniref:uncharacterized protein LOC108104288 n=1 Tax=Drosophila eugracilis TaxID=29029 RepID=UPI001BDB35F3|nr:uncharacterized protein LOC108104288 [Drosophila eugracilis]
MENKKRKGRSIVLERQDRVSIVGCQRIYIKDKTKKVKELYRRQAVGVSGPTTKKTEAADSSSSLDFEKIQRTRAQVDVLYRKIEHEIDKMKHYRNHILKRKDTRPRLESTEMTKAKDMTWGQSLKANQTKISPPDSNRCPISAQKHKGPKCRTIAVKNSPELEMKTLEVDKRASGGCCYCFRTCYQNYPNMYQNNCGNCYCACNGSCNCNMAGCCQQFNPCSGIDGDISPIQGTPFDFPYSICPRQTNRRMVTDLNTDDICRHRCSNMTERGLSPKCQKESSNRSRFCDKKNLARNEKSNKKLECKAKEETTPIKPEKIPVKLPKVKKEQTSLVDRHKTKIKTENLIASDFVSSKDIKNEADPSMLCSEEQADEKKTRMYEDYLNLYKKENCISDLEGPLGSNPTYTRMPCEKDIKREIDGKPTIKPVDSAPCSDSDRIKDLPMCNSDEISDEDHCFCDNNLEAQGLTDECLYYENALHYKPISSPHQCYEEKSPDDDNCISEDGDYSFHLKQRENRRYCDDFRPLASWNYTNPTASRMHSPQSLRSMDKGSKLVKQEIKREYSKEQDFAKTIPNGDRQVRTKDPQYQKASSVRQVLREARNTQTENLCREERPTQTDTRPMIEKAAQVCLGQEHYRERVDSPLPTPTRIINSPSIFSSHVSSAETIIKNEHYDNVSPASEKPRYNSPNSPSFQSSRNMQQMKAPSLKKFEQQDNDASHRSGYGHVYEKSEHEALDCDQYYPKQPSYRPPKDVSYTQRIPRDLQSTQVSQHSPRSQSQSHSPTRSMKTYDSKTSPSRNYPVKDHSFCSQFYPDSGQYDHNQRSVSQESYNTRRRNHKHSKDGHFEDDSDDCSMDFPTDYGSCVDKISSRYVETRPECDRYEKELANNHHRTYNQRSSRSCISSPRHYHPIEDEDVPVLKTVCEKRTRTVTFEDDCGELTEEQHVKENCQSLIDWDRAVKYHMVDNEEATDNTSRSSSSGNNTCIESTCYDDFDSCDEAQPLADHNRMPPFNACPCMYQTYITLAEMCQKKGGFIC